MKSPLVCCSIILTLSLAALSAAYAGSATWNLNPSSGDWNTAANWTPATVPNGASNIATFDVSTTIDVLLTAAITLNGIVYTPAASAFSVNTNLNGMIISGRGITNDSANIQEFLLPVDSSGGAGTMQFFNTATAGSGTAFIVEGSIINALSGGLVQFWNDASAGEGSFTLEGGGTGARTTGGRVFFNDNSTAGNATFVSKSGGDGSFGGTFTNVIFNNSSGAGSATITALGATNADTFSGSALFQDTSRAENATLIATGSTRFSGGVIHFFGSSTGDNASVKLLGSGNMQFHVNTAPSLTIGSLEGDGAVIAGSKTLIVGKNNRDTTFSGSMPTGTLNKIGTGTLVLSGTNTYLGGTIIDQGRLLTNNVAASATGTGPVQVNRGTFGGNGIVTGPVTIGTGTTPAVLSPGIHGVGLLTLQSSLTFKANTLYRWNIDAAALRADQVVAQGVTIESGAELRVNEHGTTLPLGEVFVVISNSSASPISGNFSNLADGGIITIGVNNFQANYEGGDGNDFTLTVVP